MVELIARRNYSSLEFNNIKKQSGYLDRYQEYPELLPLMTMANNLNGILNSMLQGLCWCLLETYVREDYPTTTH